MTSLALTAHMPQCYLFETTGTDDDAESVPIRLTNGGGYAHPTAPGFFEPSILGGGDDGSGLTVERSVFQNGAFGAGDVSFGAVKAADPNGDFDHLIDLGYGKTATLKLGDDTQAYSSFETVLTARCRTVSVSDTTLSFAWEGRLAELDQPACPATFAGTNSGTTGLEGTEDDIKGERKPWAMGVLRNISPKLLNSSTRIYGWNWDTDGDRLPSHSIDAVRFMASEWTFDTDYANAAALQAAAVTGGEYATCKAESLIKMGGSATLNGAVTVDVTIENTDSARYAGNLWKAILLRAGVDSGDISTSDLTALNTAAPFEAFYYAQDESFRDIADVLSASVAACYVPDRLGVYRIRQMTAPAGTPVAGFKRLEQGVTMALNEGDLISLTPQLSGEAWTPVREVKVRYGRNWTPLSPEAIATGVALADQALLSAEWRLTAPATNSDVATKYGNAVTREFDSFLANEADAEDIRDVLLALFAAQLREYRATVTYGPAFAALLDLGAVVNITHAKFGMDAGKLASIHGIKLRDSTQQAELTLWL